MRIEEGPPEAPSVGDRKRWAQTDARRESSHLGGCALRAWRQGPLRQEVGVLLLLLLSSPTLRQSLRSMSGGFKYNSPCTGILFWVPNKHKRGFKMCQACTWPCAVGSSVPEQAWPYHPPRHPQHRAGAPPQGQQNTSVPSSGQVWQQFHQPPQPLGLQEAPSYSVYQSVGVLKREDGFRGGVQRSSTAALFHFWLRCHKGAPVSPLPKRRVKAAGKAQPDNTGQALQALPF